MSNLRPSTLCLFASPPFLSRPWLNQCLRHEPCGLLTRIRASDAQWGEMGALVFLRFFNAVGFWSLLSCGGLVEEGYMLSWPLASGCSS